MTSLNKILFSLFVVYISFSNINTQDNDEELELTEISINTEFFGKDPKCGGYDPFKICISCFRSWYNIVTGKCEEPESEIENCLLYASPVDCFSCNEKFRIDPETGACIPNTIEDCRNQFGDFCEVLVL